MSPGVRDTCCQTVSAVATAERGEADWPRAPRKSAYRRRGIHNPSRFAVLMLCGLATAPLGCKGREIRECEALIEAEQYEQAAMNCDTAYQNTGDPRAGVLAAQALAKLGRPDAVEAWAGRIESENAQADILSLAGLAFWSSEDPQKDARALGAFRRELELRLRMGDSAKAASSAYSVAFFAHKLSDYSSALDHYPIAVEQATAAGKPALAGEALEGLHNVLREIGDLERARLLLDQAKQVNPKPEARHRFDIGRGLLLHQSGRPRLAQAVLEEVAAQMASSRIRQAAHLNLAEAYLETGDVPLAEKHISAAWELAGDLTTNKVLLLAVRGKTAAAGGRFEQALTDFDHALALNPSHNEAQEIYYEKGKIYESLGHLEAAVRAYSTAIELIDKARATIGPDDYRERLLTKRRRPYERLFRLQARSSLHWEALATAEKIKARTFMDAFVRLTAKPTEPARATSALEVARSGRERLNGLERLLPALGKSPVAAVRPIDAVIEALGAHYALLYLQVEDDGYWRIELAAGRPTVRRLATPSDRVETLTNQLISKPDDVTPADALGEALLAGTTLPASDASVVVITDGPLGGLPFGLLRWNGRYLAEGYRISYAPSLTALAAIESRGWDGSGAPALILADPLGDLPDAAAEGREIAALLGTSVVAGQEATFESMTSTKAPRLLHLATHTTVDPLGPSLVFADRSVSAADLLDRPLDPAIVVLASCASASRPGEGLWGSIGAAFLASGARVVIASLWSVEDRAAREFVSRFYNRMPLEDPLRALAETQRSLVAEGKGAEHWAPFVLLGSFGALTPIERNGGEVWNERI